MNPLFDLTSTSTFLDATCKYSLDGDIPFSTLHRLNSIIIDNKFPGECERLRGTASFFQVWINPPLRISVRFTGRAISIIFPMDFTPPGPHYYQSLANPFNIRIDDGDQLVIHPDNGREQLLGAELSDSEHTLTIEDGESVGAAWGLEGIRIWDRTPSVVFGRITGGALLTDVCADVSGPVSFKKSVRNMRSSQFSLLIPIPGDFSITFDAPGWKKQTFHCDIPTNGTIELNDIILEQEQLSWPSPRPLAPDEPIVIICFSHVNIWGVEAARWLQRRVDWMNKLAPHVVLDANEVNPVYTAGALKNLICPWVLCSGNHSMDGFRDAYKEQQAGLIFGPVSIAMSGKEQQDSKNWDELKTAFDNDSTLKIVCAFEPVAPMELLKENKVRFYFYGHSLIMGITHETDGIRFLRKVDANTIYRIEIGQPHTQSAPIHIERYIFPRDI